MRDQKKTKSGLLNMVALTLIMLVVALSFLATTPSSATPSSAEEYSTMCPNGFIRTQDPSSPADRNENGIVCDNGHAVIDDNIINYPACWTCHGM